MKGPERFNRVEEGPNMEEMELLRDEVRSHIISQACVEVGDIKCVKKWAKHFSAKFDQAFDELASQYQNLDSVWNLDQATIANKLHDMIDDLDMGSIPDEEDDDREPLAA